MTLSNDDLGDLWNSELWNNGTSTATEPKFIGLDFLRESPWSTGSFRNNTATDELGEHIDLSSDPFNRADGGLWRTLAESMIARATQSTEAQNDRNTNAERTEVPAERTTAEELKPIEFSNNLYASFQRAIAENRPLIVEFSQESCEWCQKLNKETMESPEMRALAERAIWVRVDPLKDEDAHGNVARLQSMLNIDRYPTTVVLNVSPTALSERGRVSGFFGPDEFSKRIEQALPQRNTATDTGTTV